MKYLAKNKIISLKQWVAKKNAKEQQLKAKDPLQPLGYQESAQLEQEIDDDILFSGMLIW